MRENSILVRRLTFLGVGCNLLERRGKSHSLRSYPPLVEGESEMCGPERGHFRLEGIFRTFVPSRSCVLFAARAGVP